MNQPISNQYVERVVDLTDPAANRILNMSVEEARECILRGPAEAVRQIEGSFALVAKEGKVVRLARSLDRPMRYFLAKRQEGPALVVAHRIDAIWDWLKQEGFGAQFHPSYTRMVPAHHVVQIHLVGCPDPDPIYERFFAPQRNAFPTDLQQLGENYIGALGHEIRQWLGSLPASEPIGVCFSGGVDSGAVFLVAYHSLLKLGMNPARLKAFTLSVENGPDLAQARTFLDRLGLGLFLEVIEAEPASLDPSGNHSGRRGLQVARCRVGHHGPGALPRNPPTLSGLEVPPGWGRRRRKPEGLPDRGEPRTDHPQRRQQSHALPGGLGAGHHQAFPDLFRGLQPVLHPHLCSRASFRASKASAPSPGPPSSSRRRASRSSR